MIFFLGVVPAISSNNPAIFSLASPSASHPPAYLSTHDDAREMADQSQDDDPVVASYNVFVNPALPPNQKIHILHQSVRYDEGNTPAFPRVPTELRVKPDSGVLEIDVPLDMMDNYDRDKGMQYGRALKETLEAKGGGSHGLAGGFGIGGPAGLGKKVADRDRRNGDWVDEVRADRVLKSQTLGGIIPKEEPLNYMIGIFQGGKLRSRSRPPQS